MVYLVWLPQGIENFRGFIQSYLKFTAGADHDLIILFNGTALDHPVPVDDYLDHLKKQHIPCKVLQNSSGQDIAAYRYAAQELNNECLLFLNSYSRILAPDWLRCFEQFYLDRVGMVGATGSWSGYADAISRYTFSFLKQPYPVTRKISVLKYWLKLKLLHSRKFPSFPNPHLRTNAFLINRKLFTSLVFPDLKNKLGAYTFENGRNSITNQIIQKGLSVLVVNRKGETFEIPEWPESHTFWNYDQEFLLISDNQTEKYRQGDSKLRAHLKIDAWGRTTRP